MTIDNQNTFFDTTASNIDTNVGSLVDESREQALWDYVTVSLSVASARSTQLAVGRYRVEIESDQVRVFLKQGNSSVTVAAGAGMVFNMIESNGTDKVAIWYMTVTDTDANGYLAGIQAASTGNVRINRLS